MTRQVTDQLYIELEYFTPEEYYTYIAEAEVDAGALFSPNIVIGIQVNQTATLDAVATMSVTAEKIIDFSADLSSEFTLTADTGQAQEATASLSSSTTLSINAVANRSAQSTLESIISLSLQGARIKQLSGSLTSEYGFNAVGSGTFIRSVDAALSANSTASIDPVDWGDGFTPFTPFNGAVIVDDPTKYGSGALYLPTTSSYAYTASQKWDYLPADSATQSIGCQGRFGIAMWLYPTETPSGGTQRYILSSYTSSPQDGWYVAFNSSRQIVFGIYKDGLGELSNTGAGTLTLNQWNYVVISRSWDSTVRGRLIISINGSEYVADGSHDYDTDANQPLYIGRNNAADLPGFVGYLDSIHIIKGGWIATTVQQSSETVIRAAVTDSSYPAGLSDLAIPTAKSILVMNFNGNADDISGAGTVECSAALSSTAALTATTGVFYANNPAALSSQSSLTCDAVKTAVATSSQSSAFDQTAQGDRFRGADSAQSAEFSQTAQVDRFRSGSSDFSSQFAQQATAVKTVSAVSATNSQADLNYAIELIKPAEITTDAIFSELVAAVKTGRVLVDCSVSATLALDASIITESDISAISTSLLATDAVKTAVVNSNLSAVSNSSIVISKKLSGGAAMASSFAVDCTVQSIINGIALTASAGTMSITGQRLRFAATALSSQAGLTAQTTATYVPEITLTASGGLLTVARIIHIDPCLTYVIPAENRNYKIIAEDRTYSIIDENRQYTIKGCD